MQIKDADGKELRRCLKKVMKGRPLYFGLMAPGSKRGKFRLSRKKSDVKPADLKQNYQPYEDAKDNNLKGGACEGVVTASRGTLTLHLNGKAPGSAISFLEHFILRELKFKLVREIRVAEETVELPAVPDEADDEELTADGVEARLRDLLQELQQLPKEARPTVLQCAASARQKLDAGDVEEADDDLDEAWSLLADVTSPLPRKPQTPVAPPSEESGVRDLVSLAAWQRRHDELTEQFTTLLKTNPDALDDEAKQRVLALLKKSSQLANEEDLSAARMAHGALDLILRDARTAPEFAVDVQPGLVAFRQAQLRWKLGLKQVTERLNELAKAVRAESPEDADLAQELGTVVEEFEDTLEEVLEQGLRAEDDTDRLEYNDQVREMIALLQQEVEDDELIELLDDCPFHQVDIRQTLNEALEEVSQYMSYTAG